MVSRLFFIPNLWIESLFKSNFLIMFSPGLGLKLILRILKILPAFSNQTYLVFPIFESLQKIFIILSSI